MRIRLHRSSPYRDWTAADYDSYEILAACGVRRPAARVARARASRPVRRAIRAALRTLRPAAYVTAATAEPGRTPAAT